MAVPSVKTQASAFCMASALPAGGVVTWVVWEGAAVPVLLPGGGEGVGEGVGEVTLLATHSGESPLSPPPDECVL